MDDDAYVVATVGLLSLTANLLNLVRLRMRQRLQNRLERRWWVQPHLTLHMRNRYGAYERLFRYFKYNNEDEFFKFTRMTPERFEHLHSLVEERLQKHSIRTPLPTELRLVLTISFLARGDSVSTTASLFRVGRTTAYNVISEVCGVIWDVLQPLYMACPRNVDEWLHVEAGFERKWNLPHCFGALDGKHVKMRAPPHSGTLYHNYKHSFSIVLMAIADSSYSFLWVDVGDYGSHNDAGVWAESNMGQLLAEGKVNLPGPSALPNSTTSTGRFLVADEIFPLKPYLMKPYPKSNLELHQRVFNYRLSRARLVIENAFGILVSRWRILLNAIGSGPKTATLITQAACCLHNFMMSDRIRYFRPGYADTRTPNGHIIPGAWRGELGPNGLNGLGRMGGGNCLAAATRQRNSLAEYFTSTEGSVPWQWDKL